MIVIIAPYSPPHRAGASHLGASRKLEAIISILARLDQSIVLVNSAHNGDQRSPLKVDQVSIAGIAMTEITPPLSAHRTVGKFRNIFSIKTVLEVVERLGKPALFWFYNGYAFEMRFAEKASVKFQVPMILEFEDWHFSRSRGFNPKPFIDYFFWRRASRLMAATFVVNSLLAHKTPTAARHTYLLPGVVPAALAAVAKGPPPFSSNTKYVNVGYFGGLTVEKGADLVLKLATMLPPEYILHVSGTGPLSTAFEMCANEFPSRLHYHGRVDDTELYRLISCCDVILNPHTSIANMRDGVFPFKVIEAIASGRLLISTPVPAVGLEAVLSSALFVEHGAEAFYNALLSSRQHYRAQAAEIAECANLANQKFGEESLLKKVRSVLEHKVLAI